jgi:hypothetical protein
MIKMLNITNDYLNTCRAKGDDLADNFVDFYFAKADLKLKLDRELQNLKSNKDWAIFLKAIPEANWFDLIEDKIPTVISNSQKQACVFYQSKEQYILQLLGLLSLPYCYAAADGAMVLYQTERMYKDVAKRLEETAIFIKELMNPLAFTPNGKGKILLFKVRLMHSAARFYIKKGNWDIGLGLPINQEDMAGTNLSFSLLIIRGLRKMGFAISFENQEHYIKYWSWIGSVLGLDDNLLPKNGKEAHDLELMISERQFRPSKEGMVLTDSLLKCFYSLNDEKQIKNKEIAGFMRFLLGDKVADILNIPKDEFSFTKQFLLKLKVTAL